MKLNKTNLDFIFTQIERVEKTSIEKTKLRVKIIFLWDELVRRVLGKKDTQKAEIKQWPSIQVASIDLNTMLGGSTYPRRTKGCCSQLLFSSQSKYNKQASSVTCADTYKIMEPQFR